MVTLDVIEEFMGMAKFDRKLCCDFNKNERCIRLVDGKRHCILDEDDDTRGSVRKIYKTKIGKFHSRFCSMYPEFKITEYIIGFSKKIESGDYEIVDNSI